MAASTLLYTLDSGVPLDLEYLGFNLPRQSVNLVLNMFLYFCLLFYVLAITNVISARVLTMSDGY